MPVTIPGLDSVSPQSNSEETLFEVPQSPAVTSDLLGGDTNVIDAVCAALHLDDQLAIPGLGSLRAPTNVKTFPLHPLFLDIPLCELKTP